MNLGEGDGEDYVEQYRVDYAEKRKADTRERVRRCRARKLLLRQSEDSVIEDQTSGQFEAFDRTDRSLQRLSARLGRELAMTVANCLRSYDPIVQHLTIEKCLGHELLDGMLPEFLIDPVKVKLRHSILSDLKGGMTDHLIGVKQSKVVMAKDIVCTLASSSKMGSRRTIANLIGVDRRNLTRGMERRLLLDTQQNAFWLNYRSARRSDALSDSLKKVVIHFWTSETTVSPNRKDIIRNRIGVNEYEEHPTHYLQVSELEFYTAFCTKEPGLKCSLTSFSNLKPWWVRRLTNWNTCCCKYHQELSDLKEGVNLLRADCQGVHLNCSCTCEMVCKNGVQVQDECSGKTVVYNSLHGLWESILCVKQDFQMWHKRDCLLGECQSCGLQLLKICPHEQASQKLVKWKSIGSEVVGYSEDGLPKKAPAVQYRETKPNELFQYLKPRLEAFVVHNYVATWQDYQFKELFDSVPGDTVISCVDFSENYSMKIQNETQSMHWRSIQVSILVHITYRLNPSWCIENNEPLLLKEVHYYVSDDKVHDSLYVQHCFLMHWDFMKAHGFLPKNHIVWSDGCSGQFKSARAWYFISRYPSLTVTDDTLPEGCHMLWNYFASGHGKGEVDGAGALCKREVRKEQLKVNGTCIQNAEQMVRFLREENNKQHCGPPSSRKCTNKYFWEIKEGAIARAQDQQCETVAGSRKQHQVRSVSGKDPTLIQYRELSCFCWACSEMDTDFPCHQRSHVGPWTLRRLKPHSSSQVRSLYDSNEEVEAGSGGEWIAEDVSIGNNIAVRADSSNDESFWIMLVDKGLHAVENTFTDPSGSEFLPGDQVIRGYWYERVRSGSRTYWLRDDKPQSYVFSHIVVASKFTMAPTAHVVKGSFGSYELKEDVLNIILNAILEAEALD